MPSYIEFRDNLKEEINKRLLGMEYAENSLDAYEKNNWAYRQAHKNGQRSTLRGILKLIEHLDHKDETNDRQPTGPTGDKV